MYKDSNWSNQKVFGKSSTGLSTELRENNLTSPTLVKLYKVHTRTCNCEIVRGFFRQQRYYELYSLDLPPPTVPPVVVHDWSRTDGILTGIVHRYHEDARWKTYSRGRFSFTSTLSGQKENRNVVKSQGIKISLLETLVGFLGFLPSNLYYLTSCDIY